VHLPKLSSALLTVEAIVLPEIECVFTLPQQLAQAGVVGFERGVVLL
jgi:hypothetical protein